MNAKTIILAGLLITATSAALAGNIYIPIDIDPPQKEEPHLGDDTPSKGSGGEPEPATNHFPDFELTGDVVEAIGPIDPGPATPKAPGGILVVDDNPPIVILDDGVGSGGLGPFGVDGKAGALVIRLACIVKAQGLVLSNVGETDAPQGLKLRWRVGADKGSLQLDKRLDAGQAALLTGIDAAAGEACGITLLS